MGIAYLPDGKAMDYEEYLKTPEWKKKKSERLAFDNWQCGICHADLDSKSQTHHLNYSQLGHEDIEKDLISVCDDCHKLFHLRWQRVEGWTENPYEHWKYYDLHHSAMFCLEHLMADYWLGGNTNMCSLDMIQSLIKQYVERPDVGPGVFICEEDVRCFFRNLRYDAYFVSIEKGEELETMLDRKFGKKGGKGGNPVRAKARSFLTKHKLPAMRRIRNDNENALILEAEVNNIVNAKEN